MHLDTVLCGWLAGWLTGFESDWRLSDYMSEDDRKSVGSKTEVHETEGRRSMGAVEEMP